MEQERETDDVSPDSVTSVTVQTRISGRTGGGRSRLFYKKKGELSHKLAKQLKSFFQLSCIMLWIGDKSVSNYHVSYHWEEDKSVSKYHVIVKKIRVFPTIMYHVIIRR